MTLIAPPRPPTPDLGEEPEALEALIEEARRRARRRRRRRGAAVVLLVAAGVAAFVGFGGRGGGDAGSAAADGARSPGPSAREAVVGALPPGSGLVLAFAFDPRTPRTVYIGTLGANTGGRVYRTTDAGVHWRSTEHSDPGWTRVDSLAADPQHPGTLYAGTGVAVYKTVNGGRSWRGWNRGLLPQPPMMAPMQVTGTPEWRRDEGWVTSLAVDPTDSSIVYAGTGGGVKKSTDGGRSWSTALWRGRYMAVAALVIDPKHPQVIYAAALVSQPADCGAPGTTRCDQSALLYKTTNGGKTWLATGLRRPDPKGNFSALSLDPQRPTTLYAAIGSTVLTSTNAGDSWRSISQGLSGSDINSLAADPRRSGTVYAASWGDTVKARSTGGIFKTTDGGRTWNRTSPGFPAYALAIDPAHPATIYVGVDQPTRIFQSTDSGRNWTTTRQDSHGR